MSDCEKCWDTPCTCGWGYRGMNKEKRLDLASRVLGVSSASLRVLPLAESHPMLLDPKWNNAGEAIMFAPRTSAWHPATERAETGRTVWVLECHQKKIYPQSYSIHAGAVEVAQGSDDWRVAQGDEAGCGWVSWYPATARETRDEQFIAWAYAEDFTPAPNVLPELGWHRGLH
jgi:hypothetical protein